MHASALHALPLNIRAARLKRPCRAQRDARGNQRLASAGAAAIVAGQELYGSAKLGCAYLPAGQAITLSSDGTPPKVKHADSVIVFCLYSVYHVLCTLSGVSPVLKALCQLETIQGVRPSKFETSKSEPLLFRRKPVGGKRRYPGAGGGRSGATAEQLNAEWSE